MKYVGLTLGDFWRLGISERGRARFFHGAA
jgi:hypothetical protein